DRSLSYPIFAEEESYTHFSGRVKRGKPIPDSFKTFIRGVLKDTEKEERNIELLEIDLNSPRPCFDKIRSLEQPIKKLIVNTKTDHPEHFYDDLVRQYISVNVLSGEIGDHQITFIVNPDTEEWMPLTLKLKAILTSAKLNYREVLVTEENGKSVLMVVGRTTKPSKRFTATNGHYLEEINKLDGCVNGLFVHIFNNNGNTISEILNNVNNSIVLIDNDLKELEIAYSLSTDDVNFEQDVLESLESNETVNKTT
uniref:Uncharacterized protein n=2 Tax=Clytia hemisphaerica TaxID=252671 RepID=A0A7M5X557_9CNID